MAKKTAKPPWPHVGWLRGRLAAHQKTQTDLGRFIAKNLNSPQKEGYIKKIFNSGRYPQLDELPLIVEFLGEAIPDTKEDAPFSQEVQVEGPVEAGALREPDMLSQAVPRSICAMTDPRYPHAPVRAFEVRGDSMNELGILDGHIVYGPDWVRTGAALTNGMVVVVERDSDGRIERSVKEVAVLPDRFEFRPRSDNPRHKAIISPRQFDGDFLAPTFRILALISVGLYDLR